MHIQQRRPLFLIAMVAVLAAGCGGGQSSSGPSSAQTQTSKVGEAVVTFSGQPKPQLSSSSSSVAVVGQAGATFSSVILEPAPNLDSTYLVNARSYLSQEGLYKLSFPSGNSQLLYQDDAYAYGPGISAYGTVAFIDLLSNNLKSVRPDGTGLTSINFTGITGAQWPNYAVDGTNRLAFIAGENVYVGPGAGGTATAIQSNASGQGVAWNPAGSQLVYAGIVSGTGFVDLFETSPTGGAPVDISPPTLRNTGTFAFPTWSSDGVSIAATYQPSGSSTIGIIKFNETLPSTYSILTASGNEEISPAFSPDGSKLAFYRENNGGQTPGIYTMDALGLNATLLMADPANDIDLGDGGLAWSPFLPKETVVAASGATFYHKAASGFLLSQAGDQFGSFMAFTTTTPSTATIVAPSGGTGTAPLTFTVSGDSITSIGYINSYFNAGTTLTLTSTPSAVVTIDATTSRVDLLAPASVAKPSLAKNSDGTLTYQASFRALYDGKGKNLAPNGASSLTVNPKTGMLISFR